MRVIFRGLSAKSHDICQFSARANVVSFGCSVSTMKRQQTNECCRFCPLTRGHEEWLVSFTRILVVNKKRLRASDGKAANCRK